MPMPLQDLSEARAPRRSAPRPAGASTGPVGHFATGLEAWGRMSLAGALALSVHLAGVSLDWCPCSLAMRRVARASLLESSRWSGSRRAGSSSVPRGNWAASRSRACCRACRSCSSAPRAASPPRWWTAAPTATCPCRWDAWWAANSSAPTTAGASTPAGECRAIPGLVGEPGAKSRCAAWHATREQDGFVWVYSTPGVEPTHEPYRFPLLDAHGYSTVRRTLRAKGSLHATAGEHARRPPHRLPPRGPVPHREEAQRD